MVRKWHTTRVLKNNYVPATGSSNDIEEVEKEIHDCIRIALLLFLELAFLSLLIRWRGGEFSRAGGAMYFKPSPLYESDSNGGIQDVAVVFYQAALEALELLRLFRPQNPCQFTARWANEGFLVSREAGHWGSARYGSLDTASDSYYGVFTPPGHFLVCVHISRYKKPRIIRNSMVVPSSFL